MSEPAQEKWFSQTIHISLIGLVGWLYPGVGGFTVYIGEAEFFGVKIVNFHIFGGFQKKKKKKLVIFRVVSFLWIFFLGSCLF